MKCQSKKDNKMCFWDAVNGLVCISVFCAFLAMIIGFGRYLYCNIKMIGTEPVSTVIEESYDLARFDGVNYFRYSGREGNNLNIYHLEGDELVEIKLFDSNYKICVTDGTPRYERVRITYEYGGITNDKYENIVYVPADEK